MAHLLSTLFFFILLVALAALVERIVRDNVAAIRSALFPRRAGSMLDEGALGRVGACLRASFPGVQEPSSDAALGYLLTRLGGNSPPRQGARASLA